MLGIDVGHSGEDAPDRVSALPILSIGLPFREQKTLGNMREDSSSASIQNLNGRASLCSLRHEAAQRRFLQACQYTSGSMVRASDMGRISQAPSPQFP